MDIMYCISQIIYLYLVYIYLNKIYSFLFLYYVYNKIYNSILSELWWDQSILTTSFLNIYFKYSYLRDTQEWKKCGMNNCIWFNSYDEIIDVVAINV